MPKQKDRVGIMKVHLSKKKNSISENTLELVGKSSKNFNGADMENIVNEAAYICVK